jgi:hypothetical protein
VDKLIELQREAFKQGAKLRYNKGYRYSEPELSKMAAKAFPNPVLVRSRMIAIRNQNPYARDQRRYIYLKVQDGLLYFSSGYTNIIPEYVAWSPAHNETPENLRLKLDLWANPTEEVEMP